MNGVSQEDKKSIAHINHVTNNCHDLVNNLYEDLMDRNNGDAKQTAQSICKVMADLIVSLTDDI
jgi:hypothetical protein|tara:strand:- start:696 stop:887 length:192 start_codon:yes stop_codon:yes gene_type:complete